MSKRKVARERTAREGVDPEIIAEFQESTRAARAGSGKLARKLAEHHSQSPELTSGDIDAAWDQSDVGEEGPGGTVATRSRADR